MVTSQIFIFGPFMIITTCEGSVSQILWSSSYREAHSNVISGAWVWPRFLSFLKKFSWQKYYFSINFHWNPSNYDYLFIVIPSMNLGLPLNLSWYLLDAQKCHILCFKYANWFHAFSVVWISLSFKPLFIGVQLVWVFWSKKIESLCYSEAMILGRFWAIQKPSHSHKLNCTSLIYKLDRMNLCVLLNCNKSTNA